jgi:hypothetical protein
VAEAVAEMERVIQRGAKRLKELQAQPAPERPAEGAEERAGLQLQEVTDAVEIRALELQHDLDRIPRQG